MKDEVNSKEHINKNICTIRKQIDKEFCFLNNGFEAVPLKFQEGSFADTAASTIWQTTA